MRTKALVAAIGAAAALLALSAGPSAAQEVLEFHGRIAMPAPMLSGELASDYATGEMLRRTCPDPGEGDEVVYKFFDLGAEFRHFFLDGPALLVNQSPGGGDSTGNVQDYDLDLYLFDRNCNALELEGDIAGSNGVGSAVASAPARYAAVAYFVGPPDLPVRLRASAAPIRG